MDVNSLHWTSSVINHDSQDFIQDVCGILTRVHTSRNAEEDGSSNDNQYAYSVTETVSSSSTSSSSILLSITTCVAQQESDVV